MSRHGGTDEARALARQRQARAEKAIDGLSKTRRARRGSDGEVGEGDSAADVEAEPQNPKFVTAVRDVIQKVDKERRATRQARGEERARRRVDYLSERLGLDEDQIEKLDSIFIEQMNAIRSLHRPEDGGAAPATRSRGSCSPSTTTAPHSRIRVSGAYSPPFESVREPPTRHTFERRIQRTQ